MVRDTKPMEAELANPQTQRGESPSRDSKIRKTRSTPSSDAVEGASDTSLADETQEALHNFEIHENTLSANVELLWEHHAEFRRRCEMLLRSDHELIILDLSHVGFVFSAYLGTIGSLLAEAHRRNKRIKLRISSSIAWLFEIVGFDRMLEIEIVR